MQIPAAALLRRVLPLLLALLLVCPVFAFGEEDWDEEDEWDDWEEAYDWQQAWEELGLFEFGDVDGDTLTIFEGVTTLGSVDEWQFEGQQLPEGGLESGPQYDHSMDWYAFHRVNLPSTLRCIGGEAFVSHHFEEFTLPATLDLLADGAFVYCSFDVLRIEATLPPEVIQYSMYNCDVKAYDVPEDHPLYKSVDGVLFSKDGKTLIDYPSGRQDTHYDVPAGVERIMDIHNEHLQTISLPIGLKTVDDYGFSGCTRLHAIALPLTVQDIGENIFYACVSLELVSLPAGMEVNKEEDRYGAAYYADDVIYRGDNGDTLAGAQSTGVVNAPGRLYNPNAKQTYVYSDVDVKIARFIYTYDSADADHTNGAYFLGKVVYIGAYQNGRVAIYEPLNGTATKYSTNYGKLLGWVNISDIVYLSTQFLFEYAEISPSNPMLVWWNHLPTDEKWTPWETVLPVQGHSYRPTLFGPFIRFEDIVTGAVFGCAIQDAVLTRMPDGTDNVYGIVYNTAPLEDIPLWAAPSGEALKLLTGGTQIRILAEEENWVQVSDGTDTGWVAAEHVLIVPEE